MTCKLVTFSGLPRAGKDTCANYVYCSIPGTIRVKLAHPLQDMTALLAGVFDNEGYHRRLFDNTLWKATPSIDIRSILNNPNSFALILSMFYTFMVKEQSVLTKLQVSKPSKTSKKGKLVSYSKEFVQDILRSGLKEILGEDRLYSPREVMQKLGTDICRNKIDTDIWISIAIETIANSFYDTNFAVVSDVRFPNELDRLKTRFNCLSVYVEGRGQDNLQHESEQHQDYLKQNSDGVIVNDGCLDYLYSTLEYKVVTPVLEEVLKQWR